MPDLRQGDDRQEPAPQPHDDPSQGAEGCPVPRMRKEEVRAVSARALGAMVRGMGESSFEDLLPWLMTTLTSEASSFISGGMGG